MIKIYEELKEKFYKIKEKGWVESKRLDYGAIGTTFENQLDIENNEFELPDFKGIEIKTKTKDSDSYITLFSCAPTGPHYHEIERLKDTYGYPDSKLSKFKVLNATLQSNYATRIGKNYFFKLRIDSKEKKIFLLIFDNKHKLVEKLVYWDFDILEEKLYRKMQHLCFVKAYKKIMYRKKYFKYYEMRIYNLKNFEKFISLISGGIIKISFKIGIYRSGKYIGKIHDHGTSIVIKEENLEKLYTLIDFFN